MADVVGLKGEVFIKKGDPDPEVVALLEEALEQAKSGKVTGIAMVKVEIDPDAFAVRFRGGRGTRHALAAGVLCMASEIGRGLWEGD